MSLGDRFRAAREQRGQTLSDVGEHLHIRSVYLAAIEEENWKAIGAPVYTRGFLRTYARYLGLDPEEAVAAFNLAENVVPGPVAAPPPSGRSTRKADQPGRLTPLLWFLSLVALGLIGFVVYLAVTPPHVVQTASSSPAARQVTALPSAVPTPLPVAQPQTLQISLTGRSWLRVVVDGNVSMEGTFPAGTAKTFRGKRALVRVGNAGGVQITVDGKPVGKLGRPGDVIEKSFVL
jgi:cytoskeleton protein RodZ